MVTTRYVRVYGPSLRRLMHVWQVRVNPDICSIWIETVNQLVRTLAYGL